MTETDPDRSGWSLDTVPRRHGQVLDLFVPPGEVGVVLWVKNRLAHVIARESGDRIPAGPEGEQGEFHVAVTAIGAKEQRSLVAGGAQGLSYTSAPKIWLNLAGPFL